MLTTDDCVHHDIHSVRNYTGSWLDWTAQEKQRGNNDD